MTSHLHSRPRCLHLEHLKMDLLSSPEEVSDFLPDTGIGVTLRFLLGLPVTCLFVSLEDRAIFLDLLKLVITVDCRWQKSHRRGTPQ